MVVGGIFKRNALKSAHYSCSSRSHQAPDELIEAQLEELVLDTIAVFVFHWRQGVLDHYKEKLAQMLHSSWLINHTIFHP